MDLPTGTISFLFTDVKAVAGCGSSIPWRGFKVVARHTGDCKLPFSENRAVVKMRGDGLLRFTAALVRNPGCVSLDKGAAAAGGSGMGGCLVPWVHRRISPTTRRRALPVNRTAAALCEQIEAPMLPDEQTEYDLELIALQQALDAGTLQRAWITGGAMDIDQAVEYALAGPNTQGR